MDTNVVQAHNATRKKKHWADHVTDHQLSIRFKLFQMPSKKRGKENINIDICYALVGYPPDNYEQIECYDLISLFEQIINRLPTPLRTPNTLTYK